MWESCYNLIYGQIDLCKSEQNQDHKDIDVENNVETNWKRSGGL